MNNTGYNTSCCLTPVSIRNISELESLLYLLFMFIIIAFYFILLTIILFLNINKISSLSVSVISAGWCRLFSRSFPQSDCVHNYMLSWCPWRLWLSYCFPRPCVLSVSFSGFGSLLCILVLSFKICLVISSRSVVPYSARVLQPTSCSILYPL